MNRTKVKIFFICFAFITALLRWSVSGHAELIERYYSKGIFPVIRWLFDHTLFYFRFPMIFVFLFFGILYLLSLIRNLFRPGTKRIDRAKKFLLSLAAFVAILYTSFMWLWGFNYLRVPIEDTLQFTPQPILVQDLKSELIVRLPALLAARNAIPNSTNIAVDSSFLPIEFEETIRARVQSTLTHYKYPASTKVQGRFLPRGVLLRLKTAGIYFPFVGESNVDAGLHPLQYSETLAHEFAHAYGFGDEGTCSFVAYLSLKDAPDPFIRYSLLLSYWRTLARNYLRYDNADYRLFRKTLPAEIVADLNAIAENRSKYPTFFPNSRNLIYDSYLKAQGIEEGLQNYNRVIMLVESFENANGDKGQLE